MFLHYQIHIKFLCVDVCLFVELLLLITLLSIPLSFSVFHVISYAVSRDPFIHNCHYELFNERHELCCYFDIKEGLQTMPLLSQVRISIQINIRHILLYIMDGWKIYINIIRLAQERRAKRIITSKTLI